MKYTATIVTILMLAVGPAAAEEIKRFGLDDASVIGTTIQTDAAVKAEGSGSVRITTKHPTTVCLGEVAELEVENAVLHYRANVKSDIEGTAFLEMWVYFGAERYFSRGLNDAVTGKSGWRVIQTPFLLKKGQQPDRVVLNIVVNGSGTLWVDDALLSKSPLKPQ